MPRKDSALKDRRVAPEGHIEEGESSHLPIDRQVDEKQEGTAGDQHLAKAKKVGQKREKLAENALEEFIAAYVEKPDPKIPPPLPPRGKKLPLYLWRKCMGCAHVDIEVAILEGNSIVVRRTVARLTKTRPQELNQYFKDGTTPLILALKEKNEGVVEALMASPLVDVELKEQKTDLAPLHLAILYNLKVTVRRMAERETRNLEIKDKRGMTPIMFAAMVGDEDIFNNLLERRVNMKVIDSEGWNVLTCAAFGGNLEIIKFLLEQGFDKDHLDKRKMTAYDWAIWNNKGPAAAYIADFKDIVDSYDPKRAKYLAKSKMSG